MQEFYLIKGATSPYLRMELINDGRYDYKKSLFDNALQDSVVTFSMKNSETGLLKVAKAPADIVLAKTDGCEEKYIIQYKWKDRDVKEAGVFEGLFEIKFNGDLTQDGVDYPKGILKVPIEERLVIYIQE